MKAKKHSREALKPGRLVASKKHPRRYIVLLLEKVKEGTGDDWRVYAFSGFPDRGPTGRLGIHEVHAYWLCLETEISE